MTWPKNQGPNGGLSYAEHIDAMPSKDGWLDYFSAGTKRVEYDGKAITKEAREAALKYLAVLETRRAPQPGIFPTEAGGIRCEWMFGSGDATSHAALLFGPSGSVVSFDTYEHDPDGMLAIGALAADVRSIAKTLREMCLG